jgi:hypothetical protein
MYSRDQGRPMQLGLSRAWNQDPLAPMYENGLPEEQPTGRERDAYFGQPLADYGVRVHAWLNDRLRTVSHQRHGLCAKLQRLLFGNPLVRRFSVATKSQDL